MCAFVHFHPLRSAIIDVFHNEDEGWLKDHVGRLLSYLVHDLKCTTIDEFATYLKGLPLHRWGKGGRPYIRIGLTGIKVHLKGAEVRAIAPFLEEFAKAKLASRPGGERL